jgi:hypothetical protein
MTGAEVESETASGKSLTNGSGNRLAVKGKEERDSDEESESSVVKVKNRPFFTLKELHSFAARPLNGRQCKNIVR